MIETGLAGKAATRARKPSAEGSSDIESRNLPRLASWAVRRLRLKPHHIAIGLGLFWFLALIASDVVASILKFEDHSTIQRVT